MGGGGAKVTPFGLFQHRSKGRKEGRKWTDSGAGEISAETGITLESGRLLRFPNIRGRKQPK